MNHGKLHEHLEGLGYAIFKSYREFPQFIIREPGKGLQDWYIYSILEDEGEEVVSLHGVKKDSEMFATLFTYYSDQGIKVISYIPGRGDHEENIRKP